MFFRRIVAVDKMDVHAALTAGSALILLLVFIGVQMPWLMIAALVLLVSLIMRAVWSIATSLSFFFQMVAFVVGLRGDEPSSFDE